MAVPLRPAAWLAVAALLAAASATQRRAFLLEPGGGPDVGPEASVDDAASLNQVASALEAAPPAPAPRSASSAAPAPASTVAPAPPPPAANATAEEPCPCRKSPPAPYSKPAPGATAAGGDAEGGGGGDAAVLKPLEKLSPEEEAAMKKAREEAAKNCIATDWTDWTACATQESTGLEAPRQLRTRSIVQPQLPGGTPCPVLDEWRTCITQTILKKPRVRSPS
mmetsp:Transcript_36841/g.106270  ORF Transcript_36841/g.106270 Transcript_36841/m.106270 type:complete len:223 (+) Transcript_36841:90-758(+)